MTPWVTLPATTITAKVDSAVMARYGRTLLFTAPQESISPTAAGMNITGIIWPGSRWPWL